MSVELVKDKPKETGAFLYVYRNWANYGRGDMLCYILNRKVNYVLFKPLDGDKTEIIDDHLLELFKQGAE